MTHPEADAFDRSRSTPDPALTQAAAAPPEGGATPTVTPEDLESAGFVRPGFAAAVTNVASALGRKLRSDEYADMMTRWTVDARAPSRAPARAEEPETAMPDVIRRARDELARLCHGRGRMTTRGLAGRDWTMCVPPRANDSDIIFADLIEAAAKWHVEAASLTTRLSALEAEREALVARKGDG